MGEIIAITSGKGGAGKTTVTANLGAALSELGKKVLLVDGDIGFGDLDLALGLENKVVYNIVDVVEGNCKILQALVRDEDENSLYLLPASRTRDDSAVSPAQFSKLLSIFKKEFDYVLVDVKTGCGTAFKSAVSSADRIFVISKPDRFSVRDTKRITYMLENKAEAAYLLINDLRMDLLREKVMAGPEEMVESIGLPLFGVILNSEDIMMQTENGEPVININANPCKAYANIARRILGENVPIVLKGRRK